MQGRQEKLGGGRDIKYKWGPLYKVKFDVKFIVQSTTISMCSMLMLGGSGGMSPQKIL